MNKCILGIMTVSLFGCNSVNQENDFNEGWSFWSESQTEKVLVDLPHDAMQYEQRVADAPSGAGGAYYLGNLYHYEKTIHLDEDPASKHITLQLEGVYHHSKVFVNDKEAGGYAYGYTGYEVCLDGLLQQGDNTIRIDADNRQTPNSRWYSGAGIYRPLHLKVQEKDAYLQQIKITTVGISPAVVHLETLHQNGEVSVAILLNGKEVATVIGDSQDITIPDAKLWSAEHPTLYTALVTLKKDGKVMETQEVEFGIRTLSWNSKEGLLVNGEKTLLRGGCLHHDNGILGAAEYDDAAVRRLEIMKQYGFNAIRSAHNPCSEAVLRAADRLGIYVMDELWDTWTEKKTAYDYGNFFLDNWKSDAELLVKKDFNHPSVIMYSIGNEVAEPATPEGLALEKDIVAHLHQLDSSRPATAGMNLMIQLMSTMGVNMFNSANQQQVENVSSEEYNKMTQASGEGMMQAVLAPQVDAICSPGLDLLDIAGYNYGNLRFGMDAQLHPDRVTVGSETMPYSIYDNWQMVEQIPNLIGDFMWTAWDYIGEVGCGAWVYSDKPEAVSFNKPYPGVLAGAGALDLIGNPTAEAYMAKTTWLKDDKPYITVCPIVPGKQPLKSMWRGSNAIPSWSWTGFEGMETQVEVYTSASSVKLYLNDTLIGEKNTEKNCATFTLSYQPGTLKAVTVGKDGKEHQDILTSATGKESLKLVAEKDSYKAGNLIFVHIDLVGENGEVIANKDRELHVQAEGAQLLGFGSGAFETICTLHSGTYPTHYGQSMAVLRCKKAGTVTLTATGEGMETKTLKINVKE